MKPIFSYPERQKPPKTAYFPSCCPHRPKDSSDKESAFKKNRKFITLSKHISTSCDPAQPQITPKTPVKAAKAEYSQNKGAMMKFPKQNDFQEDKFSFLQQIRSYNPNSQQKQLSQEQPTFTLESSKESNKSNENNNLNSILDSINNEMFSNLLVSSTVKEKIVLSGSLGSISEVLSDLERSDSYYNSLTNTGRLHT